MHTRWLNSSRCYGNVTGLEFSPDDLDYLGRPTRDAEMAKLLQANRNSDRLQAAQDGKRCRELAQLYPPTRRLLLTREAKTKKADGYGVSFAEWCPSDLRSALLMCPHCPKILKYAACLSTHLWSRHSQFYENLGAAAEVRLAFLNVCGNDLITLGVYSNF
jgi:hypothetical protein